MFNPDQWRLNSEYTEQWQWNWPKKIHIRNILIQTMHATHLVSGLNRVKMSQVSTELNCLRSQHREKCYGNVYLFNELNVFSHTIFELSSTSRENKIITRPCNPVLILFILHQLWVRDVVVPNLDLQWSETQSDSQSPNSIFTQKRYTPDQGNCEEELRNILLKGINWFQSFERTSPKKQKVICQRAHVWKKYSLYQCYIIDSRSV